ncbi:hypothetical protein NQ315_016440 [Exocentrus adspersus]|uniref:Dysbindin n=1 Tax=Exocentrus adspersus TaxID=1586481 RepID=A0AAV8VQ35_9CUCU|nr:hypothetical protein NQ315_016440 [Exocentrus adspersus]
MLSSLKEKILNVKQTVQLFNADGNDRKRRKDVNLYAGAEILQHFQDHWAELHDINEQNAKKADEVAEEIDKVTHKITSSKKNLSLITHILSTSNLVQNITNCLDNVRDLYAQTDRIEKDLIDLENLIDEVQFENLKSKHRYHLEQYEERKSETLKSFHKSLEDNHSKKLEEYEAKKKREMEERQRVFQDAFKADLEIYKNLGALPETNQSQRNGAILEEIQIDYDPNELDQFFNEHA